MKKYFYSVLAASMLFACSQEDIVDVTGGESQVKTFKVEIPQLESRTVGGIEIGAGTQANTLIYAMYENGGDATTPLITGVVTDEGSDEKDNGEFIVKVPMAKDLKYDLLFFAYNEGNSAFEIASEPKTTDLKNLKFKANQTANIDAFDAFVGSLKAQGVNDPNDVTLKRPFAQINAATTEADLDNAATLKLDVTQSNLVIKGVPQFYNVLEATASGSVDVTYAASPIMECDDATTNNQKYPNEMIEVDGTNYYYLTLAYVLAGEVTTTSTHNATFQFQREGGQSVSTLEIVSLPIQRNYRTNVIGDLLTKSEEYTIKIDAEFGGEHVVGVWNGETEEVEEKEGVYYITNASQLAWIAEEVNSATGTNFKNSTVVLATDIDLANYAWTPIGLTGDVTGFEGTFDGQGHTISNLFIDQTAERKYQAAGLFGSLTGIVQNVTVANATIKNLDVTTVTSCGTAVVVGSSQSGATIQNVHVKNAVVSSNRIVGGIAGYFKGTITNCSVDGIELTATQDALADGTFDNGDKVGAIMAYANGAVTLKDNSVSDFVINAYRDCGGVAGCANDAACVISGNTVSDGKIVYEKENAKAIVGRHDNNATGYEDNNTSSNVTIVKNSEIVTSQDAFTAALQRGGTIYLGKNSVSVEGRAATADYTWSSAAKSFEIIAVEEGVVIDMANVYQQSLCANNSVAASFEGVTLNYNNVDYSGFYHSTSETYKNCHINGVVWTYAPKATFEGCTFNQTGDAYNIRMYGADTNEILVKDCEFTSYCKSILIYAESANKYDVTIENSTFKSENYDNKAAVQMHTEYGIHGTLKMNDVTVSGAYLQFPGNGGLYNEINHNQKNEDDTYVTTTKFKKIIDGKEVIETFNALKEAIENAGEGETIVLAGDIDTKGTALTLKSGQTLDLNKHTLSQNGDNRGIMLKEGASIKNGTIKHDGIVAAVRAWEIESIEDIEIELTSPATDQVRTAIAVQQGGHVGTIKNVKIKGVSQGIEVPYQATVDLIENVTVEQSANGIKPGIALMINGGKVGLAKDCTFKGSDYGVEMLLKGVFNVGLELVNCTVEGGTAAIYAHDEKGISNTSGTLTLKYDKETKDNLEGKVVWDFEEECQGVVKHNEPAE